jgi:hypothetical protein
LISIRARVASHEQETYGIRSRNHGHLHSPASVS